MQWGAGLRNSGLSEPATAASRDLGHSGPLPYARATAMLQTVRSLDQLSGIQHSQEWNARQPPARLSVLLASVSALTLLVSVSAADAQSVIDNDEIVTVPGNRANPWALTDILYVGDTGTGTLQIGMGGQVSAPTVRIGNGAGSAGVVTVSGSGASLSVDTAVRVGVAGSGTLNITNGGTVTSLSAFLGSEAGSNGTVVLRDEGSRWEASSFAVGWGGTGFLRIEAGADLVTSSQASVGRNGAGTAVVTGPGSTWSMHGLTVGGFAAGTLTVSDGGSITSTGQAIIGGGNQQSSVTVTGAGSQWDANIIFLGVENSGMLTVTEWASVTAADTFVGTSTSGTALVTGPGSSLTSTILSVGYGATGTLRVENGGTLTTGSTIIGGWAGVSGFATVTGRGSSWRHLGNLLIGDPGNGSLTVENGGSLESLTATIGNAAGSTGTVTVTGDGTTWANSGSLRVGASGTGTLMIKDGGEVSAGTISIGQGGTLRVGTGGQAGRLATPLVTNAGALAFDHSDNVSFAGAISGAGTLAKSGAGRLTLTAANTYTGTTNVTGGTLMVDGSLASTAIQVQSGATLTGSGNLAGDVTMADGATLSGVSGRTLGIGSLALTSAANLTVALNASSTDPLFDVARDLTLNGSLTIAENSDLSGATSYDLFRFGGVLTSAPLVLTSAPIGYKLSNFALDTGSGKVTLSLTDAAGQQYWTQGPGLWTSFGWSNPDGSLLTRWEEDTAVFRGSGGTVTVDGTQTFSALRFEADGYSLVPGMGGTLTIAGARGDVRVESGRTATIAAPIGGTGQLAKGGGGALILSGVNTYQGGTWLAAGTLGISSDTNLGDALGGLAIEGGATLRTLADLTTPRAVTLGAGGGILDTDAHEVELSGPVEGVGSLTKLGTGVLSLSGLNTYAGGTTVSAGTLVGTATSFGSGIITNNAALVIEQATDATLANAIDGTGRLTKTGAGQLNVTGTNTLSGPTYVEAGRLAVNGSLASSPVTVQANAVLSGTGTVGGLVVQNGGTAAPGNSIGTLNVAGNVGFQAGSIYQVEVNAAGQSDRIAAIGMGTLTGGTVQVLAETGTYQPSTTYTILTANGGVSGTFAGVTSSFAFLDPTLGYDVNNVFLTLVRKTEPTDPIDPGEPAPTPVAFNSVAVSKNQYRTADAVEALGSGNRLFDAVIGQSVAGARQAFDALSGEAHAPAMAVAYEDSRLVREAILTRLRRQPLGSWLPIFVQGRYAAAYAADLPGASSHPVTVPVGAAPHYSLWGEGFGSWGKIDGNGNAAALDKSTGGFILGADAQVSDAVRVGLAGGFTRTTFDVDGRVSSGSNDSIFAALYGSSSWGALNLRLGASYAWHDFDVRRTVSFPGFSDSTHASYDGWTAQAFGELGYQFSLGAVLLEPFVGASILRLHTDGFAEEGGVAALTGYGQDQDLTTTTLGLRAEARLSQDLPLTLRGLLGWRHAFGDVAPESLLAFAGGESFFTVQGTPVDRDVLVAEVGLDWRASDAISLGIGYSGQVGERAQEHSIKGSFVWRFGTR